MTLRPALAAVLGIALLRCVHGPVSGPPVAAPYPELPGWVSSEGMYNVGLAFADINGDGYDDLVVASGNDCSQQPLVVYYNDRTGHFPREPDYRSADDAHNTNLAVGDIDGDGRLDVAVSVAFTEAGGLSSGFVKVYFNQGNGLSPTPGYTTADRYSTFGCALGDVNGDGRLDLVAAVSNEGETSAPGAQRVYFNADGALSTTPGWRSSDQVTAMSVQIGDTDGDGLLDLVFGGGPQGSSRIYSAALEPGGGIRIGASPSWTVPSGSLIVPFLDIGPFGAAGTGVMLSNNGWACSGSLCDRAHFVGYLPPLAGAQWQSTSEGNGGGVVLADVDGDGWTDLIAGRWGSPQQIDICQASGSPLEIYRGTAAGFEREPSYRSRTVSVVESIAAADLDRAALQRATQPFEISHPQAAVTLPRPAIAGVLAVRRGGVLLGRGQYATVPGRSWISFAHLLAAGEHVEVDYAYSTALDLGVGNMGLPGTFIFYHR